MRLHVTFKLYLPEGVATLDEVEEWIAWQLGEKEVVDSTHPLLGRALVFDDLRATDVDVEER